MSLPTITVTPLQAKRAATWRVKCSMCNAIGKRHTKFAAQKLAVMHAEEKHDQDAFIKTMN